MRRTAVSACVVVIAAVIAGVGSPATARPPVPDPALLPSGGAPAPPDADRTTDRVLEPGGGTGRAPDTSCPADSRFRVRLAAHPGHGASRRGHRHRGATPSPATRTATGGRLRVDWGRHGRLRRTRHTRRRSHRGCPGSRIRVRRWCARCPADHDSPIERTVLGPGTRRRRHGPQCHRLRRRAHTRPRAPSSGGSGCDRREHLGGGMPDALPKGCSTAPWARRCSTPPMSETSLWSWRPGTPIPAARQSCIARSCCSRSRSVEFRDDSGVAGLVRRLRA